MFQVQQNQGKGGKASLIFLCVDIIDMSHTYKHGTVRKDPVRTEPISQIKK
jgi:hypothetical protein